jgi:hypothetical protein
MLMRLCAITRDDFVADFLGQAVRIGEFPHP